jgi:arsenate reductase
MARILFLCTGNSCRSQMAEGWGRRLAGEGTEVWSAGTAPLGIDPRAAQVMAEVGVDLSEQRSKHLDEVPVSDLDLVVTLCGGARDSCPVLPVDVRRVHWPLPDPASATGSEAEVLDFFRAVRDDIRARVEALMRARGAAEDPRDS